MASLRLSAGGLPPDKPDWFSCSQQLYLVAGLSFESVPAYVYLHRQADFTLRWEAEEEGR